MTDSAGEDRARASSDTGYDKAQSQSPAVSANTSSAPVKAVRLYNWMFHNVCVIVLHLSHPFDTAVYTGHAD